MLSQMLNSGLLAGRKWGASGVQVGGKCATPFLGVLSPARGAFLLQSPLFPNFQKSSSRLHAAPLRDQKHALACARCDRALACAAWPFFNIRALSPARRASARQLVSRSEIFNFFQNRALACARAPFWRTKRSRLRAVRSRSRLRGVAVF